jgi:DNA polymerase-3 subunit gamma/tau
LVKFDCPIQPKIQFEITLLKLIHMERTENLDRLLTELEQLKKKLSNQPELDAVNPGKPKKTQPDSDTISSNGQTTDEVDGQNGHSDRDPTVQKAGLSAETSETKEEAVTDNSPQQNVSTASHSESASAEEPDAEIATADESEEGKDSDGLFGKSSLGKPAPANGSEPKTESATKTQVKEKRAPKDVSLQEIKEQWDSFIEELRQQVPQMLYFQMQRVDPIKLKNGELLLRCNDDFAKKIVDENKRRLGKILEDVIGAFLAFECVVQKDESEPEESMSPYERFKRLQKRDPTIKKLVELFGAELDYNLNQ